MAEDDRTSGTGKDKVSKDGEISEGGLRGKHGPHEIGDYGRIPEEGDNTYRVGEKIARSTTKPKPVRDKYVGDVFSDALREAEREKKERLKREEEDNGPNNLGGIEEISAPEPIEPLRNAGAETRPQKPSKEEKKAPEPIEASKEAGIEPTPQKLPKEEEPRDYTQLSLEEPEKTPPEPQEE